ncbi:MAG: hypothetical protein AAGM84_09955 [Pseudomonadota bacterium]
MTRFLTALFALLLLALPASAQMVNPAGYWRCVSNSQVVSIDLELQVAPNQQLQHRGSIIYVQTNRVFQVQGFGRWAVIPPDQPGQSPLVHFQMQPAAGNHAIFSVYARPTGNPNFMNNRFQNPQTGNLIETSCQRLG